MPKPLEFSANLRFGHLVSVAKVEKPGRGQHWMFKCDCGNTIIRRITTTNLKSANSCGCGTWNVEKRWYHYYPPEYLSWRGMRQRCLQPAQANWKWYGARGITVCERWLTSFENFLADMGPRPTPKHTLGRINNERGYELGNCEWQTMREQNAERKVLRWPL